MYSNQQQSDMKDLLLSFIVLCGQFAHGQITNGSFEQNGSFSLTGWEYTCDQPQPVMDTPTGGGVWSASKESGHAKGCFPNYLFQRLTNVQNGDIITLSGWGRCTSFGFNTCLGAFMGLGTINNGIFTIEENVSVADSLWNYMSITDTVDISTGDTSIVILNAGFIGGPINPTPALFDEIVLTTQTSISEANSAQLHVLLVDNGNTLMISTGTNDMTGIACYDLTGQTLPINAQRAGNGYALNIADHNIGMYILRVSTTTGDLTAKFVKR